MDVKNVVENDFNVRFVCSDKSAYIFSARRKDVWHFLLVEVPGESESVINLEITQKHWPRYILAKSYQAASQGEQLNVRGWPVFLTEPSGHTIRIFERTITIPNWMIKLIQADAIKLVDVSSEIKYGQAGYSVEGVNSSKGIPLLGMLCTAPDSETGRCMRES